MKIQKSKSNHKKILIIIASIVLVLALGGVTYAFLKNNTSESQKSSDTNKTSEESPEKPSKDEQKKSDADDKADYIDDQKANNGSTTPPAAVALDITTRTEGDAAVISTKLTNITSGTCTLTISNGSTSVKESAEVIYTPSYSTCAGFSVNKSKLAGNRWNITIEVATESSTLKGTAVHNF